MRVTRSLLVVGMGLLGLLAGCSKEEAPEVLPRVGVLQVQPTDFAARVTLTGDVQARVQTDLSFRVGGKIISRSVDVGDHVKANQVLARLDPKDLQNNVDSAKAEVFAAQARVTQTSAAFVRQQKLLPKGYTSQSEYDSAEAALRSNQSALKAAQAQLANAQEQLSYTALVSEADGVITERQAEVGQVVQATMPIFSLARDGDRDAVFNVYESLLVAPPSDAGVMVSLLDDPKVQAQGFVREITPTVSAQSGTVQVKVALRNVPAAMRLGSPVTATANAQGRPSIELPWSALTKALHEPAVWVVGEGDKVELRKVQVTRYLTGKVVIAQGIKGGETVVVSGGQLLHPGMQVEKIDAKGGGAAP
ncbi:MULTISPECIES: efflux RND transporter periplasmic adaptor subunit [Pseudomonas]|jgi:RND family efflux transporter MFP subunit|uniref:Efflux transporter, RND family, MFP subunit n=1 Tax=Pseudomonas putida (strain W619) TaxID=390235 RepID=B1J279_PSEPW|nr:MULTISPECIES: efflux RND transporter periplasmic adaptor subunit [Pseudomonas]MDH1572376.1 efflux RND transporter periplasmic adaptor subunit [Pseudomonas sp. GD03746]QQE84387.1 efflux RND transporter periplasmic adaptor subunit [Pseudomonas putida]UTL81484.1 efflux RND transporter periplasmic adaptor subunit [Pseudomonas putida]HEN8709905.1 efflux RND transporter periplasmic adaptor subunit [Pseudomonas putida]HEN8718000.1 efflux RND transporter periplasmic adaptor subunit [Pseudomonas put